MKARLALLLCFALAACGGGGGSSAGSVVAVITTAPSPSPSPMRLVWSDEFNGAANAPVDPTKWGSNVGGDGWGNNESEYYTNATDKTQPNYTSANAFQDGKGDLVIRAIKQSVPYDTCWYGACTYTSARLITLGTFSQQYGRFEVRMKVPPGQGMWPAFWMLGLSNDWPNCGEVDIMEAIGSTPNVAYGSVHEPAPGGAVASASQSYTLPTGNLSDAFHVYAVNWQPGRLDFYFDGVLYESVTPASMPSNGTWVFDRQPFYLILNLAIGGDWPGRPMHRPSFPRTFSSTTSASISN